MSMSIGTLKKQIKGNDIKSIYLFYGPEEFLKKYYLNSIEEKILDKNTLAFNKIILEDKISVSKIIDNCDTLPVFSERKLVIVKNSEFFKGSKDSKRDNKNKEEKDEVKMENKTKKSKSNVDTILEYIKNFPSYTCLVFYEDEIDKLLAYTGERKTITDDDVKNVGSITSKSIIFNLTDAIVDKNMAASLRLLNELITLKEPIPKIIFMIARQFRQLLQVKILVENGVSSREIASKLSLHPFIADKLRKTSSNFTLEQLKESIEELYECDKAIKTGQMKDKIAVELLIEKLISS